MREAKKMLWGLPPLTVYTSKWQNLQNGSCAKWRLRSAWASAQSDQSLRCPHEEILGPYLSIERTAKTLIRLSGFPGWSESWWAHMPFVGFVMRCLKCLKSVITKTRLFKYIENFTTKTRKFSDRNSDIFFFFSISAQNIDCGYSIEPPRRGGSNEYPQSMFLSRNKKNNVYPCKPQFYFIKVGFKGIKII